MGNPNLDICHLICFIYNLSHIWEIPDTSCRLRVITVLLYFCSLQECHYYNLEVKFIQGNSCSRVFGDSAEFYCAAQVCFSIAFQKNADEKSKGRCCLICCRTMETHLFFCKLLLYRNLHWVKSWFSLTKLNTYSTSKHSVWNCAANKKIFRKGMFSTCDFCQLIYEYL